MELQKKFGSYYKISKHCKTSPAFKYFSAREVKLPNGSSFQYVSIVDIIRAITSDPSFVIQDSASSDFIIRDVKDGSVYKTNTFFMENPTALTIIIYSDALQITNPLGASKGKFKIVNIYFTLAEIQKHLRAKTENFFITLSVKESDLKYFRNEVYAPLIADLKVLETEGILLPDGQVKKAGILFHLGDNLEAHKVGGFSPCFSSYEICRFCHQQHKDLPLISGVPKAAPWTKEEYNDALDGDNRHFGLVEKCLFNELQSFHAVGGFPLDFLHDFLERVCSFDALNALKALMSQGHFTLIEYNNFLLNLPLESYEVGDRPMAVQITSEKLTGKAMSISLHIKLMPFILWWLLPAKREMESCLLDIVIILNKINEYLLADSGLRRSLSGLL